jgi:hypothetical protein
MINRRTLLQTLASCAAYSLTVTGFVRPKLNCTRHIRCGDRHKLICTGDNWFPLVTKYQGTFNAGFGELGDMFCETFAFNRGEDGKWRGSVTYLSGKKQRGFVQDALTGARKEFKVFDTKWHSLLYGKLPPIEDVTESEFRAA